MLGWFKKKFKKQDKAAQQETPEYEKKSSDTLFSDSGQQEKTGAPERDLPTRKETEPAVIDHRDDSHLQTNAQENTLLDETTVQDSSRKVATEAVGDSPAAADHQGLETDLPDEKPQITATTAGTTFDAVAMVDGLADSAPTSSAADTSPQAGTETTEIKIPATLVRPVKHEVPDQDVVQPVAKKQPTPGKNSQATKKKTFFSRLADRLGKTRETLTYQIDALFLGKKEISAELLDDLEEILITADLGVATSQELIDYARRKVKRKELSDVNSLKNALKKQIRRFIAENDQDATLVMPDKGPFVIMVIGVNGVGKTTTIGKIAHKFVQSGSSVLLAACDTFRAAAVAQLKIWGERNNVEVVAHKEGADPSSVAYNALEIAAAKNIDVVLVDTAGRMHTKDNLMEELKKIKRVMGKKMSGAPHEVMLVIDATTGQNGISQAKLFDAAVDVTGISLTKLDGTSKGGIVVNICREMKIPIRFIGIGERLDDLRDFDAAEFAEALFHSPDTKQQ